MNTYNGNPPTHSTLQEQTSEEREARKLVPLRQQEILARVLAADPEQAERLGGHIVQASYSGFVHYETAYRLPPDEYHPDGIYLVLLGQAEHANQPDNPGINVSMMATYNLDGGPCYLPVDSPTGSGPDYYRGTLRGHYMVWDPQTERAVRHGEDIISTDPRAHEAINALAQALHAHDQAVTQQALDAQASEDVPAEES